ncbi:MAG: acyl-CoA dehydrogenase family protein [Candidatus Binataceae bacterium]
MDFGLSDEQRQLKDSARAFLAGKCLPAAVRTAMAGREGYPRELYAEIAKLGWNGIVVPEKFGGAGLGMLDLAMVLEEGGYAAMPGPFLFSSAIAANAIALGGSDEMKAKWLPAIATGEAIGTVAIAEAAGGFDPRDLHAIASKDDSGRRLDGIKMFVPYAHIADFIVVAAKQTGTPESGLYVAETKAAGVKSRVLQDLDLTRRVSVVEFDRAPVLALGGGDLFEKAIDIGAVAIAADSLGGMERALEMAVEYSKVREQFGRPIGSFQALKHAAAEIVAELEPARALLWYAAHAIDSGASDASRAASMAKSMLCGIYSRGTDRAVLMHGGIGFTWDHDLHLWFKRARFNESYFGSPQFHRERIAALGNY